MTELEYWDEVYSLARQYADEYVREAVGRLDEATLYDEDAFHEAMDEIRLCLKGEMPDFVREAENEVQMTLK